MLIEILGAVGMLAFLVSSATIGVRLLLLHRRTSQVPELALAVGFLVGGVVGYAPETVFLSFDFFSPEVEATGLLVTQVAIRIAALSILLFTYSVFRSGVLWAKCWVTLLFGLLLLSWWMFPQTQTYAENARDQLWYDVFTVARSTCIGWGATESFIYYSKLRRRAALGLSDPVLTHRFLMWGVGLGAMTLLMASTLLASWVGVDPTVSGWVLLESTAGMTGAVTLWLTFFPTQAYRRWVLGRANATNEAAENAPD
jgi:hypothetical protein